MKVLKATRLSNPHGKRTKRKMSPKQIRIFGTKRQKAALRARRTRPAVKAHRARTKSNPLVVTLKPVPISNPHRRRNTTVAAKRAVKANRRRVHARSRRRNRKPNTHHRRRTRTRNPRPVMVARRVNRRRRTRRNGPGTRIVVMAPRRQNRRRNGSRNPTLFGSSLGSKSALKMLGGGLVGVAATKFIPTWLPASITGGIAGSTIGKVALSGASALAAWKLASMLDPTFGEGVLFGGLMQTASVALNAFLPNFTIAGVPISLGDLVEGRFAVPQNPLRQMGGGQQAISAPANMPAASGMKVTTSGLGRAYPAAY